MPGGTRLFSAEAMPRSALHFELEFGGRRSRNKARTGLLGKGQFELVKQQSQVRFRLGVAWHYQTAAIGSRQPRVQCLNRRQLFQHRSWGQTRSMRPQAMLQRRRQTIRQKRNQDVRLYPTLQLM